MVQPVSITHQFNGDATADAMVNAAALDTALGNLANTQNAEMAERKRLIGDGGILAQQCVRNVNLHPEVLSILSGIIPLAAVAIVVTTNVALTGLQIVDGYQMVAGDRVLLVNQNNSFQNGVWLAAAGAWTRPTDFVTGSTLTAQIAVTSLNGTANIATQWMLVAAATVDTATQTWIQISGPSRWLIAGSGLTTSGLAAAVDVDGTTIEINVGTGKVGVKALGIDSAQIKAGAVIAAKLGALAVETAAINTAAVVNAKLDNMAAATLKGSVAGGVPADLTAAQAAAILPAVIGDTGTGGTKGLVPAPAAGDTALKKFLSADGAWELLPTTINSAIPQNIAAEPSTGHPFTTPGVYSWVVPAGVVAIMAEVWGGGGGGAAGSVTGQGGGGGGHAKAPIVTVPGETLTVEVGVGGASNTAGTASYLKRGATALLTGGAGYTGAISSGGGGTGAGGVGAKDATVPVAMLMNGQPGGGYTTNYGGPGGDSPRGGPGGPGAFSATDLAGTPGIAPGGGGGGGLNNNSPGGVGADGMVMITY
jgi:hypothetical protein